MRVHVFARLLPASRGTVCRGAAGRHGGLRDLKTMRGSPIMRALIAFLVLLGLGYPMHRFLRADAEPQRVATAIPAAGPVQVHLQIEFTQPPRSLRVLSLGKEVWSETSVSADMERDLALLFPKEGIELQFDFDWPEEVRASARVKLTDHQGEEYTRYVWAQGATSEVFSFP